MAEGEECGAAPDGSLLDKYVTQRDESAFTALVQRHGQMVWGVCRRLLPSHHDTEDAFQATFLILAVKATSIVPRGMVANWLHGVAYQTALKARALSARRRRTEVQVQELPEPIVAEHASCSDTRSLIDEELCRLPDRHRAAVVLCDLEGNTRSEAARHLGVPEGTIAGWLARGRAKLANRLARRGVVLSGGGLALLLSHAAASGQVPAALLSSTTQAAIAFATRRATETISPLAITLTNRGLKSMFFKRYTLPLACLVIGVLGVVGVTITHLAAAGPDDKKQATPEQPTKEQPAKQPKIDDTADDLTLKLKGKWINVIEKPRAAKRIIIENKDDDDKSNQGWTVITPVLAPTIEQDWDGERLKLHLLRETDVGGGVKAKGRVEYGFATWESKERGRKLGDYHMTFRMKGELLVVETFYIPTGEFFPQHWRCEYKKDK
jgi:RNA polymerase sigma-70 factor (ECF subfamily)